MKWAYLVLAIIVAGSAAFALIQVGLLQEKILADEPQLLTSSNSAFQSMQQVAKASADVEEAAYATLGRVAALADTANEIASILNKRENVEIDQAHEATKKLNEVLDQTKATVAQVGETAKATTMAIQTIAQDAHATLQNGQGVLKAASDDLTDPAIKESVQNAETATAAAMASASNVADTTADIKTFVHRETAPVRGTWNTIKAFLREFAGPAAQVATAVK